MKIDWEGWVDEATILPSPYADNRPIDSVVDLIVIHNISLPPSQFGGVWIDDFFTGKLDSRKHPYFRKISELRVSAHILIRRNGELHQYVPFLRRAWHAGVSYYGTRSGCNDFSIGIELEGSDYIPYEWSQYKKLGLLSRILIQTYPELSPERIVGHQDIAPDRKTDPGPAFDWGLFKTCLNQAT